MSGPVITEPRDVPSSVIFSTGTFDARPPLIRSKHQGLTLRTFRFDPAKPARPRAVVLMCHGYASHSMFEWMLPSKPGAPHDTYSGSVIDGLVRAGFSVRALDHQSHGQSQGEPRCYFNQFDDLAAEAAAYAEAEMESDPRLQGLKLFLFGESMGGATAIKMALKAPQRYAGLVLYAPMISLDLVKQQPIFGPIRNCHVEPLAACISVVAPRLPIAKPALNTLWPLAQLELDTDPLTYSGDCRARVAYEFKRVTDDFMLDGGLSELEVPFVTFHAAKDTFTDPKGSEVLVKEAKAKDKTLNRCGPGLEVDVDIWHALAAEPGREVVFAKALEWLEARAPKL